MPVSRATKTDASPSSAKYRLPKEFRHIKIGPKACPLGVKQYSIRGGDSLYILRSKNPFSTSPFNRLLKMFGEIPRLSWN
ncbi:hypothetical protein SAMN05192563_10071 [Paraburkholderia aspalathi]|uniref:Uncharacterized protein n=1 Tax=Paraburkholderia aspalathi TaxID=1324617 RepID=A0A1I7CLI3_9BURK|nr:hypothetical protein SAMN05192563_10071 [Paraburkholderia aspalathi]